jgi:pimeloyl-ACP methyl ester carboxylesterase
LILWAGRDKHFPIAHAERLHAAIPGSSLQVLPDAEHGMAWYLAEDVASQRGAFLAAE